MLSQDAERDKVSVKALQIGFISQQNTLQIMTDLDSKTDGHSQSVNYS